MSVIGSNILAGASGQGGDYTIARSLRFRSSASAYLNRTVSTASNRKTYTWSAWVKRGSLGVQQGLFGSNNGATYPRTNLYFTSSDTLNYFDENAAGGNIGVFATTQVFRDPSAYYHIVFAVDTTQATDTNRVKFYVNGTQITSFTTATYPTLNFEGQINNTAYPQTIGRIDGGNYFDGYMTEVNFIDGQALTPSSFGETSASTGVWQPKKYAGTYGTNGFYLPFTDNSSTTTLGADSSGNGNNWTTNNISLTAGSTYDSMTDVPTLTSATASNYCVLNAVAPVSGWTISDGNLKFTSTTTSGNSACRATFGVSSGKYYWEVLASNMLGVGIVDDTAANNARIGSGTYSYGYQWNGYVVNNNSDTAVSTFTTNDIIGIALNLDSGTVAFYKNNTLIHTFSSLSSRVYYPAVGDSSGDATLPTASVNFGQRPFAYTPPTGFVALNTFNLPTPTIGATASTQANKYFDATLYTGNGSTQTITNAGGFSPDLVWAKVRNAAFSHQIYDTVRGATLRLASDSTSAEGTVSTGLTAFNSNGFSLGSDGAINGNGNTFVGWQWRGSDSSAVSNTAGSITSTVSANTSAGFSVVSWTSNGSNSISTMGHGLGVAPAMIIAKRRSSTGGDWRVYHKNMSVPTDRFLKLNSTDSEQNPSKTIWSTSSTTFGIWQSDICTNGDTAIAYVFSEVAGYSKFGSYTGNGSTDGTFVYTGFRPKFIMVKRTDSTGFWAMMDSSRSSFNVADDALYANASNAESTPAQNVDFISNGFKFRSTDSDTNSNGGTHVYMAFAENPFKYSLGK